MQDETLPLTSSAPKEQVIPEYKNYDNLFIFLSIAIFCHFPRPTIGNSYTQVLDLVYVPQLNSKSPEYAPYPQQVSVLHYFCYIPDSQTLLCFYLKRR